MPIAAPKTKFHVPVNNGNTVSSNANKTAYIAENFRTLFHRFDKSSKHIGNAIRQGRITVIIPPVPPATIMVLTVTVRKMKFHEEILMEIKIMDFNVVQVFLRIYPVKAFSKFRR